MEDMDRQSIILFLTVGSFLLLISPIVIFCLGIQNSLGVFIVPLIPSSVLAIISEGMLVQEIKRKGVRRRIQGKLILTLVPAILIVLSLFLISLLLLTSLFNLSFFGRPADSIVLWILSFFTALSCGEAALIVMPHGWTRSTINLIGFLFLFLLVAVLIGLSGWVLIILVITISPMLLIALLSILFRTWSASGDPWADSRDWNEKKEW